VAKVKPKNRIDLSQEEGFGAERRGLCGTKAKSFQLAALVEHGLEIHRKVAPGAMSIRSEVREAFLRAMKAISWGDVAAQR
jgi:hypothetical protein